LGYLDLGGCRHIRRGKLVRRVGRGSRCYSQSKTALTRSGASSSPKTTALPLAPAALNSRFQIEHFGIAAHPSFSKVSGVSSTIDRHEITSPEILDPIEPWNGRTTGTAQVRASKNLSP
jgi:hypothetical protein